MRRIIITLIAMLLMTFLKSQSIDSIQVFEWKNNFKIKVEGIKPGTGHHISRIDYEIIDDKINIDLFFIHCPGWGVLTPYDTIVDLGILLSQDYIITCRTIFDIYLDSSTYCAIYYELNTIDSLTIYYSTIGIKNDSELINNNVLIYPNPIGDFFIIKFKSQLNSKITIDIIDLNGNIIERIESNIKETKIDFTEQSKGIYLIRIYNQKKEEITNRIFKIE